jgi:hypothetical protein
MNKRIRELAEQAQKIVVGYTDGGYTEIKALDQEKFAELIIKECLEQVRDEVQYEYDWKLADAVTKRVMEHFGVE